jgi:hypothetical protein
VGVVERGCVGEACRRSQAEEESEEGIGAGAVGGVLQDEVRGQVAGAEFAAEVLRYPREVMGSGVAIR